MNISKALRREGKVQKRRNGMQISGKSVFTIQEEQKKRALQIKQERERKEAERQETLDK